MSRMYSENKYKNYGKLQSLHPSQNLTDVMNQVRMESRMERQNWSKNREIDSKVLSTLWRGTNVRKSSSPTCLECGVINNRVSEQTAYGKCQLRALWVARHSRDCVAKVLQIVEERLLKCPSKYLKKYLFKVSQCQQWTQHSLTLEISTIE